jgi:putative transposase
MQRAVLPDVAHHLTQRGVGQQPTFFSDADCRVYLRLVDANAARSGVSLLGYCLMSNHVHWIVIPAGADSLTKAFGEAHNRYAHYANAVLERHGHFWQNRFFSCPMDEAHLWTALRYIERNPIRAGLVGAAEDWPWSSARCHTGRRPAPSWLSMSAWQERFTIGEWRIMLAAETVAAADLELRRSTYSGRPLGSAEFIQRGEQVLGRPLEPRKRGRPRQQQPAALATTAQPGLFVGE